MVVDTYHLDEDSKCLEFMNLFQGRSLAILQDLDVTATRYEDMKEAMLNAYKVTVEDSCGQFLKEE